MSVVEDDIVRHRRRQINEGRAANSLANLEDEIIDKEKEFCHVFLLGDEDAHKKLRLLANEISILYEFLRLRNELSNNMKSKLSSLNKN
jgi:hypothetical protein